MKSLKEIIDLINAISGKNASFSYAEIQQKEGEPTKIVNVTPEINPKTVIKFLDNKEIENFILQSLFELKKDAEKDEEGQYKIGTEQMRMIAQILNFVMQKVQPATKATVLREFKLKSATTRGRKSAKGKTTTQTEPKEEETKKEKTK